MIGIVYILKSLKNGKRYIGSTNNIQRRLKEHNNGKTTYTRNTGPYELIFKQEFETLLQARKAEYWIKKQKDSKLIDRILEEGIIKEF